MERGNIHKKTAIYMIGSDVGEKILKGHIVQEAEEEAGATWYQRYMAESRHELKV
jgi:hypothetical protein